jgi:hypothetical protein
MTSRSEVPAEFTTAANLASDKQLKFLSDLVDEREIPEEARDRLKAAIEAREISKRGASQYIERLLAKPKRANGNRVHVQYDEILLDNDEVKRVGKLVIPGEPPVWILAGSYGIDTAADDRFTNDSSFFKVWVGDRGGWGVDLYVSDDTTRVKLAFASQLAVLKVIAKDPTAAAAMFGHEFKRCGICGRGLTKDESRERGIGPVCAERL